jgi:hypothetical protein
MKRWGLVGLLIVGGGLIGGAIAWNQATHLPQWYTANQMIPPNPTSARQSAQQVEQKLQALQTPQTTISLDEQEINDVVTATIDRVSRQAQIPEVVRGVNTQLVNGQLKAGAVIDFAKLSAGENAGNKQMMLAEALKRVPGLADREVYIGIESTPQIRNGQVQLDPNTKVKVGSLSLSLQDMANYLGVTPEKLQQELNQALPIALSNLPVDEVNVVDQNLILHSPNAK